MGEPEKKLPNPGPAPTDRVDSVGSRFQHDDVHHFGDAGDDDYDHTDGEGAGFQQAALESQGKSTRAQANAQDKGASTKEGDTSIEIPPVKDAPVAHLDDKQWADLQKNIDSTTASFDQKIVELDKQVAVNTPSLTMLQKMSIETMVKLGKTEFQIDDPRQKGDAPESIKSQRQSLQTELEKGHEFQRVQLDGMKPIELQPEAFRVVKAAVLISSGDDTKIKAGEEQLIKLVANNPNLQIDRDFADTVLNAYLEMANRRHARGLPDWKSELKADQFLPKEPSAETGEKISDPMTHLQSANETFWSKGIKSALPEFNKAFEAAERQTANANKERLELFVSGLSKNAALANAQARGEDVEALTDERLDIQERENRAAKNATANDTMRLSIGINTCFAKIASGDKMMYTEGVEQLGKFMAQNPSMSLDEQFSANCIKAFKAHYENDGLAVAQAGQPGGADGHQPAGQLAAGKDGAKGGGADDPANNGAGDTKDFKPGWHQIDLAQKYNDSDGDDKKVAPYFKDQLTTALLIAAGLGMATTSITRTIRQFRENRELRAKYGPKDLETESPNKDTFLRRRGFEKEPVEVLGKTSESDRVVIHHPDQSKDWKKTPKDQALDLPADFDLKKGQYGDYERLRVNKADYFADKTGNVFLLREDKLYPTKEIEVLSQEQFAKDAREIRSLHDPDTIRDVVDHLKQGSRSFENVQAKMIEIAKGLGLPEPKLISQDLAPDDIRTASADYHMGTGDIRFPERDFNGWGQLKSEVVRKVTHEMVHLEQDTLMIRRLADKLGIGKDFANADQLQQLRDAYNKETNGFELQPDFARRVIDSRAGRQLSPSEQERADGYLQRDKSGLVRRVALLESQKIVTDSLKELRNDTADGFIKKLAEGKIPLGVLGPDPPEELKQLVERARRDEDLTSTPGWNDKSVKGQLSETIRGRAQQLNGYYFDIYTADKFEIDAYDVSRFTELEDTRDPLNRNPQKEESIALAYRLIEPDTQKSFLHALDEASKQPGFDNLSQSEKSEVLTKRFKEALQAGLKLEGRDLPGSLNSVEIKVGDYKQCALVLTNGATEADRHFEIRVPESHLASEFMRHNALATIYGDTYHLMAKDIEMNSPVTHLLQTGEHDRSSNSDALRVRAEQALSAERTSFRENPALIFDVAREAAVGNFAGERIPWNVESALRDGRGFLSSLEPSVIKEKLQVILDGPRPELALAVLERAGVGKELFQNGTALSSVEAARKSLAAYDAAHANDSPSASIRRELAEFARLNSKVDSGVVHRIAFEQIDQALAGVKFEGDRESYGRLAGLVREEARKSSSSMKVVLTEVAQYLEGKAGITAPESTAVSTEAPAKEIVKPAHPLERHLGLPADIATDKPMSERLTESRQLLGSKEGGEPAARWARHARLVDEALSRYRELELKDDTRTAVQNSEFADLQKGLAAERRARATMLGARQLDADKMDLQSTTGGNARGGDATQGYVVKQVRLLLDEPSAALGGRTPAEAGFRILTFRPGTALDGLGWDAILLNTNTGDFVFLDPTRDNPASEGSKKKDLAAMHADGLVFVDANKPDANRQSVQEALELNLKRFDPIRRARTNVDFGGDKGIGRPLSGTLNVVDVDVIGAEFSAGQQVPDDKRDFRQVIEQTKQIADHADRMQTAGELSERFSAIRETQVAIIDQMNSMAAHQRNLARNGIDTRDSGQRATELREYTGVASNKSMFFEYASTETAEIADAAGRSFKQQEAKAEQARAAIRSVTDRLGNTKDLEALRKQTESWDVQKSIESAPTREEAAENLGFALVAFDEARQRENDPLHTKIRVEFSDDPRMEKAELNFRLDGAQIDLIGLDGDKIVDREGKFTFKASEIETVIVLPDKFRTDPVFRGKVVEAVFIQLAKLDLLTSGQALPANMTAKDVAGNKKQLAAMDAKQLEIMNSWKSELANEIKKASTTPKPTEAAPTTVSQKPDPKESAGMQQVEQEQQEQQQRPDEGTKPAEQQTPIERAPAVEVQTRTPANVATLDEAVAEFSRVLESKNVAPDSPLKADFDSLVTTLRENETVHTKDAIKYIAQLAQQIEGKQTLGAADVENFDLMLLKMENAFGKFGTERHRNDLRTAFSASADKSSHVEVAKLAQLVAKAKVQVPKGELSYSGIPGWKLKMGGDKPAMRDGKLILVHDGVMKIRSDKVSELGHQYSSATPNSDKTTTINLGFDKPVEIALSPIELVMQQSGGQTGGQDSCSVCVASFLKNIGSADGLAGVIASGKFATPQGLQDHVGKVGPGGKQVNQGLLYNILSDKTIGILTESMNPRDFGLNSQNLGLVTKDMLASKGPAIYVAVDPYVTNGDASSSHVYIVTVDSNGKSTILDPYHGFVADYSNRKLESLSVVTGEVAEHAKQNLGLTKPTESHNVSDNVSSPIASEALKTYLVNVEHKLSQEETQNHLEALKEITGEMFRNFGLLSRENLAAVEQANLISKAGIEAAADLGPNDSRLVIKEMHGRELKVIEPKSYNSKTGSFLISDGDTTREVSLKDCQVVIQVGKGTAGSEATREVLKRFTELGMMIENKSGTGPGAAKQVHAQLDKLAHAFDTAATAQAAEKVGTPTAAAVKGFKFGVDKGVTQTKFGITYGDKSFTHLELVDRAVDELSKEKDALAKDNEGNKNQSKIDALDKSIVKLKQMQTDLNEGRQLNTADLRIVVDKSLGSEMSLMKGMKAEGRRGEIAKSAISEAGTYAVLVTMLAGLIIESQGEEAGSLNLEYAPVRRTR